MSTYIELEEPKTDKLPVISLMEVEGHGNLLVITALHIVFKAVGWKWNEHITNMGEYVASLEEIIYGVSADSMHSASLGEVFKQLLRAERLLKFLILVL